jgi:hypothetical protein
MRRLRVAATFLGAAGGGGVPRPGRRKPADSSRHPDLEDERTLASDAPLRLIDVLTGD